MLLFAVAVAVVSILLLLLGFVPLGNELEDVVRVGPPTTEPGAGGMEEEAVSNTAVVVVANVGVAVGAEEWACP